MAIPKQKGIQVSGQIPITKGIATSKDHICFSFEALEKNEYFNLDGTCQNWASDLFDALQKASVITTKDVYAGKYSGKQSTFRIHSHKDVTNPCAKPLKINIEDMWQIRISKSKGGIHGIFVENIFYVIWFDPLHNLYPDKNHGGLRKVIPPSSCCKDREEKIAKLLEENRRLKEENKIAKMLLEEAQ